MGFWFFLLFLLIIVGVVETRELLKCWLRYYDIYFLKKWLLKCGGEEREKKKKTGDSLLIVSGKLSFFFFFKLLGDGKGGNNRKNLTLFFFLLTEKGWNHGHWHTWLCFLVFFFFFRNDSHRFVVMVIQGLSHVLFLFFPGNHCGQNAGII